MAGLGDWDVGSEDEGEERNGANYLSCPLGREPPFIELERVCVAGDVGPRCPMLGCSACRTVK